MKNSYWLVMSVVIIVFDQWSKVTAEAWLKLQPQYTDVVIPGYLKWQLAYNEGASFGIGSGMRWFFVTMGIVISVGIIVWLSKNSRTHRFLGFGLALVLAGALGNVWDRIMLGHVIDFINASNPLFNWPIFNVADIAICIGVGVMVIDMLLVSGRKADNKATVA